MEQDLQTIMSWITLALSVTALGSNLYAFFTSSSKVNAAQIEALRKNQVEHDRRIQRMEDGIAQLPSREITHRLELLMEKMNGRLDTVDEKLKPIQALGDRLNEVLLEQAKK